MVEQWIEVHGKICPLTGAPLCMTDLHEMPELGDEIRKFLLQSATAASVAAAAAGANTNAVSSSSGSSVLHSSSGAAAAKPSGSDDLYDF